MCAVEPCRQRPSMEECASSTEKTKNLLLIIVIDIVTKAAGSRSIRSSIGMYFKLIVPQYFVCIDRMRGSDMSQYESDIICC